MKARDVMNPAVVAVRPDTPISDIAKTLRDHRISAVPVVDEVGSLVGMVSEGDLIGRDEAEREARLDWWLTLLAEGEALNPEFLANVRSSEWRARDVMTAPVVAAGEETEIEVARLLTAHRIKRVPVLRVAGSSASSAAPILSERSPRAANRRRRTDRRNSGRCCCRDRAAASPSTAWSGQFQAGRCGRNGADRSGFSQLMADHKHQELLHGEEHRRTAAERRRLKVAELIDRHISDEKWRGLIH
ncbi:MAG: CBS domain-containing protein [Alphaproteobacteria bacterium]|nr:CBS domain-containing protein [Alphaproteobacteria bacterium]